MVYLLTTLKIRDKGTYFFSITQIKNEKSPVMSDFSTIYDNFSYCHASIPPLKAKSVTFQLMVTSLDA